MRSPTLSRYYIQCDLATKLEDWPDERFWAELKARFPKNIADRIVTGPSIEKSIAPLRSFVTEPMCYGRLFLAGDAAHIVPPTGAKGLNLAVSDVFYLARGMIDAIKARQNRLHRRLLRHGAASSVGAERLSWWLTTLLHRFPGDTPFDERMRENQLDYLARSDVAQASLAEQHVGLPFED
jgi:p-hydroxybenzoate 3-monooxygenase